MRVGPEDIRVLILESETSAADLALYVRGIDDPSVNQDHLKAATYIMLDQAIGEYNTMFLIGSIDW